MIALWLLAGCGGAPFEAYWDPATAPALTAVSPAEAEGVAGGQTVTLEGSKLGSTRTVTFGGRNATIVEASDNRVTVEVPATVAGGGTVDVAVVTDAGPARVQDAFTYHAPDAAWLADETASLAVVRVDCPMETTGITGDGPAALWWCGFERGHAFATGWFGSAPQPGLAGDLAGLAEVSSLPAPGEVRVLGPAELSPGRPKVFAPHAEDEVLSVTTAQDFPAHLAFLQDRLDTALEGYSWAEYVEAVDGPLASQYDAEGCWLGDAPVDVSVGGTLRLQEAPADGVAFVDLGFVVREDFGDGEVYETPALTASAEVTVEDGVLKSEVTGAAVGYDLYGGGFEGFGMGISDVLPDASYDVDWTRLGETVTLGSVRAPSPLVVEFPDLLSGDVEIARDSDLIVSWASTGSDNDPWYVSVEIRVYDADLDDPNGLTELARLVGRGEEATGSLLIPAEALGALPEAPNRLDDALDLTGTWAEMTVARHQLRKVPLPEGGTVVVDFVHAVQGMLRLQ